MANSLRVDILQEAMKKVSRENQEKSFFFYLGILGESKKNEKISALISDNTES